MFLRTKQYLLFALLLILPLQGMGAALHAVTCAPQGHHGLATADAGHEHPGHEHGMRHKHPDGSGGIGGDHSQHQCCHLFSAAAAAIGSTVKADPPVLESSVLPFEVSFILEQPQRPPRT